RMLRSGQAATAPMQAPPAMARDCPRDTAPQHGNAAWRAPRGHVPAVATGAERTVAAPVTTERVRAPAVADVTAPARARPCTFCARARSAGWALMVSPAMPAGAHAPASGPHLHGRRVGRPFGRGRDGRVLQPAGGHGAGLARSRSGESPGTATAWIGPRPGPDATRPVASGPRSRWRPRHPR